MLKMYMLIILSNDTLLSEKYGIEHLTYLQNIKSSYPIHKVNHLADFRVTVETPVTHTTNVTNQRNNKEETIFTCLFFVILLNQYLNFCFFGKSGYLMSEPQRPRTEGI